MSDDALTQHQDYDIQVALPNGDGWDYRTIAIADTFNIAREVSYSIARQGLRMRYPRSENLRDATKGWWVVTPETAEGLNGATWNKYTTESIADRAVLLAKEMKVRSRVGSIINELRQIADESQSSKAREMIRKGILDTGRAVFQPLTSGDITEIGLEMMPDYYDTLAEARDVQGIDAENERCTACGEIHLGGGGMTAQELLMLADAEWQREIDPIADAMSEVEGVQA